MHTDFTATTKVCSRCKQEQAITEFALKVKTTGQRQSHCRSCQKEISAAHYRDNKAKKVVRAVELRAQKGAVLRETVRQALSGQVCSYCNATEDLTFKVNPGYTGPRVSAVCNAGMAEETLQEAMQNSTICCKKCMYVRGAAIMVEHTRRRRSGDDLPKNTVTKAEYKRRHTTVKTDRRKTIHVSAD